MIVQATASENTLEIHAASNQNEIGITVDNTGVPVYAMKDHDKLDNRNIPEQHSMNAITDLMETFKTVSSASISNSEIENLFK